MHKNPSSMRSLSSSSQPVIELREDFLVPQHSKSYFDAVSKQYSDAVVPPPNLCFLSRQELGGDANVATHAYCYQGGLTELQERRKLLESDSGTEQNIDLRSYIQSHRSSVYVEAPLVKEQSDFVVGLGTTPRAVAGNRKDDEDCIFELRRYHLKLGYDTVPKFLDLYGAGLPSKLHAPGTDPETSLVTLLYSEVGRLNEVIELWRHGNGVPGMEQSRVAARKATEWRSAIASIADLAIEFHSTIHRPVWTALPPMKK
eukprot:CAMPEP_0172395010 /NCGR_PEP_ID=MMETSP1061-20121228/17474_1 /TAXON_ID=37318 /ORGANISM="Pseudo-nitzschia pungens, Strain cf. pungens" /LENGTH=257 /DNA_ID=CAMNT_0013126481 /DNA_START=155 /DNA_END=928 /DNA_ORIENTATION=+